MIEDLCRPTVVGRSVRMTLLALLVGGTIMLMLSYDPAEAATTFTVTENGDDADINLSNSGCDSSTDTGDQCTLRAAIEEANDTPGADTIDFDIGSGTASAKTISPTSPLPTITKPVTIDGYSQPGAEENTLAEGTDAALNVQLDGLSAGALTDALIITADDCAIKGLVIKDFGGLAIQILGFGSTDNTIEGNYIGVSRAGTAARGNVGGVFIEGASNKVGGLQPGSRNVISGNDENGVEFDISAAVENRVEGKFIGTTADSRGDLGNTVDGVSVQNGAELTAVGGTLSGAPNRIAYNNGDGVQVAGNGTIGTNVLSNRIYDNGRLRIDLDSDGVTPNDPGDPDAGPNNLQNFPTIVIARKSNSTGRMTISGRLNSNPTQEFVVQCFLTDADPASDHGEGSRLLYTDPTSTNADGRASFTCEIPRSLLGLQPGQAVSATATNVATGDTSEFSRNKALVIVP